LTNNRLGGNFKAESIPSGAPARAVIFFFFHPIFAIAKAAPMKTPIPIILTLLVLLFTALFSTTNAQTKQAPYQPMNTLSAPNAQNSPNFNDPTSPALQTVPDDSGNKIEGDKSLEKNDWQKPAKEIPNLWEYDKKKEFRKLLDLKKIQPIV
jgi:hypothetical protein